MPKKSLFDILSALKDGEDVKNPVSLTKRSNLACFAESEHRKSLILLNCSENTQLVLLG